MADFRKCFYALAAVVLLFGVVPAANAQALSCVASASSPIVRAEGITEGTGDIVLNCTGGTATPATMPATNIPTYNISVQLNTNITNQILTQGGGVGTVNQFVDAVLLIDNPAPANFNFGANAFAIPPVGIPGPLAAQTDFTNGVVQNAYLARRTSDNTITFNGVPVEAGNPRTLRITNIRANASGIAPALITAFLTTTQTNPAFQPLALTNNALNVASPQPGAAFATRSATAGSFSTQSVLLCADLNASLAQGTAAAIATPSFELRFTEQQAAAFKTAANETSPISLAALNPGGQTPGIGGVTNGTRLRAVFTNIPSSVKVFVSSTQLPVGANSETTAGTTATFVTTTDPGGAGGTLAAPTTLGTITAPAANLVQLPISGGVATAVWEITAANQNASEVLSFGVVLASDAPVPVSGIGTGTINGSLAPVSAVKVMDASAPIPRFVDTSTSSNFVSVSACQTNLLFPFVINQAGYNTGLAIVNTSQDTLSSNNAQGGVCTINYHGTREGGAALPAATATTNPIAAGQMLSFTVMDGVGSITNGTSAALPGGLPPAPGFLGYIIARCDFRFGHGFAFVSDVGVNKVAMGYLALVLDTHQARSGVSNSENLGN
jgi:hypothetical protein